MRETEHPWNCEGPYSFPKPLLSSVFQKRKLRPGEGRGLVQFMTELGPELGFPAP